MSWLPWLTVLLALLFVVCAYGWFHATAEARCLRWQLNTIGARLTRLARRIDSELAEIDRRGNDARADALFLHGEAVRAGMGGERG